MHFDPDEGGGTLARLASLQAPRNHIYAISRTYYPSVAGVCFNFNNRSPSYENSIELAPLESPPTPSSMNQHLTHVRSQLLALLKVVATNRPSLSNVLKWLLILVSFTSAAVLRRLLVIWFKAWRSPLRALPGPKSKSLFLGNFDLRFDPENALPHEQWISEYGTTFSYAGLLNVSFQVCAKDLDLIFG